MAALRLLRELLKAWAVAPFEGGGAILKAVSGEKIAL